ncbi:DUF1801 domain-containing protein [Cellulomonas sp. RIT-PI-Y]|jgi:uncharacterized protein YdhG (YjbR/CyaY superfamily)|uniref:iron chaperone n=1 Tax=Cellulomonas sp. RIT-PI-Y TaxID=3035297 RepID=UPI0021DA95A3|nr:DUF1801 domain-containing protein [Cellulomonas sp. RIT-PI-Y]
MSEVDAQIAGLDEEIRPAVQRVYARALALVPDAEQGVSYGMPALRYRDRPLLAVTTGRAGCAVYPFSSEVTAAVMSGLDGFAATKGGIRFGHGQPLPESAVDALITGRRDEIDAALDRRRSATA